MMNIKTEVQKLVKLLGLTFLLVNNFIEIKASDKSLIDKDVLCIKTKLNSSVKSRIKDALKKKNWNGKLILCDFLINDEELKKVLFLLAYDPNFEKIKLGLKKLDLHNNNLSQIPKELGSLIKLKKLYLDNNQLCKIPSELRHLTRLQKLSLANNQLRQIPKEICQLTQLQYLGFSGNQLKQIPMELCQMIELKSLNLSKNQLRQVPRNLGQLVQLQVLDCSDNQLSEVPKELGQLAALLVLDLNENQLSKIPKEIGQIEELKQLSLQVNQLTQFPKELGKMRLLNYIGFSCNQMNQIPSGSKSYLIPLRILFANYNEREDKLIKLKNFFSLRIMNSEKHSGQLSSEQIGEIYCQEGQSKQTAVALLASLKKNNKKITSNKDSASIKTVIPKDVLQLLAGHILPHFFPHKPLVEISISEILCSIIKLKTDENPKEFLSFRINTVLDMTKEEKEQVYDAIIPNLIGVDRNEYEREFRECYANNEISLGFSMPQVQSCNLYPTLYHSKEEFDALKLELKKEIKEVYRDLATTLNNLFHLPEGLREKINLEILYQ